MVVFLDNAVHLGFFIPAVKLYFTQESLAAFINTELSGSDKRRSPPDTAENIVVCFTDIESSVTAYALDKACRRRINYYSLNLVNADDFRKLFKLRIMLLVGSGMFFFPAVIVIFRHTHSRIVGNAP